MLSASQLLPDTNLLVRNLSFHVFQCYFTIIRAIIKIVFNNKHHALLSYCGVKISSDLDGGVFLYHHYML